MDDHDDDAAQEELMKSMGFGAFGGTDNRPKQIKPNNKLPPKPPATGANAQAQGQPQPIENRMAQVRERQSGGQQGGRGGRGGRGHGDNQPSKRQKTDNDDEGGFSRGKNPNKWAGWEQGGTGYSEWFYSPSFGTYTPLPSSLVVKC